MANHYGTTVLPAGNAKLGDKALVEKHINFVYSRVFAALRNRVFYSLEDLNCAIRELLELLNNELIQGRDFSRRMRFESEEHSALSALPDYSGQSGQGIPGK